jgi:hypothetical protein
MEKKLLQSLYPLLFLSILSCTLLYRPCSSWELTILAPCRYVSAGVVVP